MKTLVVKNLSDAPVNTNNVKWKGKIWHPVVKPSGSFIKHYTTPIHTKLNLSVFEKVFSNPDKPTEMVIVNLKSTKPKKEKVKVERVKLDKSGNIKVKKVTVIKNNSNSVKKTGNRGRPASGIVFKWPKKNFTVQNAADLNKCEKYSITNEMNRQTKLGKKGIKFVVIKQIRKEGQRGKPTNLFAGIK